MPETEHGPEQELGPKLADALQSKADAVRWGRGRGMAAEARRRVHRRRQKLVVASVVVVVAAAIGGVWNMVGSPSPVATSANDSATAGGAGGDTKESAPDAVDSCPPVEKIQLSADGSPGPRAGTGLDLEMPVYGLQACRYRLAPDATMLLGSGTFNATRAQQIADAIKVLPERNPDLPVFKCVPEQARPGEAIVLLFDTALGRREVWVQYDGCANAGFFTGSQTYGLFAAPLKLFMVGTLRPTGGTYLDHLTGW